MSISGRFNPTVLVLVIGLFVSGALFYQVDEYEHVVAEDNFKRLAGDRLSAIENRIFAELTIMNSVVGLFQESEEVSRAAFASFVNTVNSGTKSFQALEWIPRVPAAQRERYVAAARKDGFDDFDFREKSPSGVMVSAGARNTYYPVLYVAPYKGNEGALGFDLASNPIRRQALIEARDSGRFVVSGAIKLVQLKENNTGALFFAPVYTSGLPRETVAQRQQSLTGFALGVVRISSLISGIYDAADSDSLKSVAGIDIYVYDVAATVDQQLLYTHASRARKQPPPVLSLSEATKETFFKKTIEVGGRSWIVVAKPVTAGFAHGVLWEGWLVLLASLIITLLLTGYIRIHMRRAEEVNNLVEQRTRELEERETYISAVVDTVVDGIITIDAKGNVQTINPAAEGIFGFNAIEVIGQNVKCLMPEPYHSEHDDYLSRFSETGDARIIGIGREVVGRRKDGSTFPMDLAVSETEVAGIPVFVGIVRDITERKQNEKMKAEFISTVSHELRTPLTSIKGSLGLIRSGAIAQLPDKLKAMIDIAYNNSNRLVRLINDILDIEKIEAGKMDFQMTVLDLVPLLDQAMAANKGYADTHGITFHIGDTLPQAVVRGDSDRLMQVLANLMSNAAKFSPEGAQVIISLRRHGSGYRVAVSDEGPGIDDDFHDNIFEKFLQADSSDSRQRGGTGLGLNISKSIVEHLGGVINFETELGRGSTFYFDLPAYFEVAAGPQVKTAGNYHILICEDDADTAQLLKLMLQMDGFTTDIAKTAAEAVALLAEGRYDAMTLDLMLPDKDGVSLIRELRSDPATANLPIIVISAKAADGKKEINGDAIGIIDWLEKPIDQDRLAEDLKRAVSPSEGDRPCILHVEDDPDIVAVVAALIGDMAELDSARTLSEAKSKLQEKCYDLVILDLILPDGDGEELLPLLKGADHKSTPIIVFSVKDISKQAAGNFHAQLIKSTTSNSSLMATIRGSIDVQKRMNKTEQNNAK